MKASLRLLFVALLFSLCQPGSAQNYPDQASGDTANYPYWMEMMQNPAAEFRSTQSAFEKYWAGRSDYKGNGWKVFKRWEYIHQDLVQPDGTLPAPGYFAEQYQQYLSDHPSFSPSGNWQQLGPVALPGNNTGQPNGMGRINGIAFHPTQANILYVGSPSGGLWRSLDGGSTWTVLTANLPSLGVSTILVHPTTPTTLFIGTGDRDAGDSPGIGVYKSVDDGVTWSVSSTGMGSLTVGMMLFHPGDPNILLAVTSGGIFKSIDGGTNWSRKSSNASNYKDIKFKPGDPTIVYATEGGRFYRSSNTGDSWTQITAGIISGSRMVIGVSPNQPNWVYLCQTNGVFAGFLKSTDNGVTFAAQSTSPNLMDYGCTGSGTASQAWYDLCMEVDPLNANIVYVGGVNIWKSLNGGTSGSWVINSHWVGSSWGTSCAPSVHADIHALTWSPLNGNLYTGCDGGIYYTSNGGTNWTDISSGLGIAQIYRIGQSATDPNITINGYQDNGTATNNGTTFTTIYGGDGMEGVIDYTNSSVRYGELYYGTIFRTLGGGYGTINNNMTESGGWVTPFILHPSDPNIMFVGMKNVWKSNNVKAPSTGSVSWTMISSGETSNCIVLEASPASPDVLYAVRSGVLKRTDNASATTPVWNTCTLPGGNTPSDLAAHPSDANIVYATAGQRVYKSTDKGMNWGNISGTLPSININCIVYDKNTNEGLYIGNKTGIFYKEAAMSDWVAYISGLPTVDVRELDIYYDTNNAGNNLLKAATYGRGLWESDLMGLLAVTPPVQNVPYTMGSTSFDVTCNTIWYATNNTLWCNITGSGAGNGTILVNYTENPSVYPREDTITVTGGNAQPVMVKVIQAGAPATLSVTPPNQDVSHTAGNTYFNVTSNSSWTAVCDSAWCILSSAGGSGNDTIGAYFTENPTLLTRIAHITVTVAGLPPQVVTVTQAGQPVTLSVYPFNRDVNALAGSTYFMVNSNTNWSVSIDSAWCTSNTSGFGNDTIYVDYLENPYYAPRTATLTVTVAGINPQPVTVNQGQSTVGIAEQGHETIQIFPNPGDGKFTVIAPKSDPIMHLQVSDLTGKRIFSHTYDGLQRIYIDLGNVAKGVYIIQLQSLERVIVRRLIVN